MWLVFSNHLGGEDRVVGKSSFGNGLVIEGFGCGGSESGGGIERAKNKRQRHKYGSFYTTFI